MYMLYALPIFFLCTLGPAALVYVFSKWYLKKEEKKNET